MQEGRGQWWSRAPTFINLGVNLSRVLLIYVASYRDARAEDFLASS